MAALLLALLLPVQADTAKVRALVEKVTSDDIAASEEALAQLFALGPPALDAIRGERDRAAGDLKTKLGKTIRSIERTERLRKATQSPGPITLKETKPVAEVLEALKKASGQPIVFSGLEGIVSVELEKAPFWEALDAICKAHGGVLWHVRRGEIVVEKGAYRERPRVIAGNIVIFLDRFLCDFPVKDLQDSEVSLLGGVAWAAGARPSRLLPTVDSVTDDKGTELSMDPDYHHLRAWGDPKAADPLVLTIEPRFRSIPSATASTLTVKGRVLTKYILDAERILSVPGPKANSTFKAGTYGVSVNHADLSGRTVTIRVGVDWKGDKMAYWLDAAEWRFVDDEGKSIVPASEFGSFGLGGSKNNLSYTLTATLPENRSVAALELWIASDVEDVVIPFDFKGLKIR